MNTLLLISSIFSWGLLLFLIFLLFGTLRTVGLLTWRLEQMEATTPRRVGRDGIQRGSKAPDFTLPSVAGSEISLRDFDGRKRLLVFMQDGCTPCHAIVPELNKLHRQGDVKVLVVNNSGVDGGRAWVARTGAEFSVLLQQEFSVSKRFQVFATPYAFFINEQGVIASKGIVNNRQHIGYVLGRADLMAPNPQSESTEPVVSTGDERERELAGSIDGASVSDGILVTKGD